MSDGINITKEIIIDGSLITTREEFFDALRTQLDSNVLTGSNLDALHDVLTAISYSADITVLEREILEHNLGNYWNKIYEVFMDSLDENYNLSISFEENDL